LASLRVYISKYLKVAEGDDRRVLMLKNEQCCAIAPTMEEAQEREIDMGELLTKNEKKNLKN
jgi:hypothetical protein